jgi:hypothetical protein
MSCLTLHHRGSGRRTETVGNETKPQNGQSTLWPDTVASVSLAMTILTVLTLMYQAIMP